MPEHRVGRIWIPAAQALPGTAALVVVGFAGLHLEASTEAAALLFLFVVVPVAVWARPVASAAGLDPGDLEPGLLLYPRLQLRPGSALTRELRGIRREIPIPLMSGYVGGAVASPARAAGANEVLKKPVPAQGLATSLARVLRP